MEVCRLCLDLQSNNTYSPLEGTYKDMVQVVAPELNIEISNAPIVCNECSSNLDELFIFKTKCFENEQKIRPKCENTKNKLRLKEVLDGTTNVDGTPLKIEKAKERICRTCMGHIECESFTILKPSEPDAYLDSMLTMCLPEVDLELTKDPVICETCMDNLQKLHHFKSTCLDIEDKLANYCETHGTNSSDQINLHSVLEYDVSNTDSGFVNVKSEVFDEESVDTSMKSENDSEMTGDTELKQEEVDIKSEAGTSSASDKSKPPTEGNPKTIKTGQIMEKLKKCSYCFFTTSKTGHLNRHVNVVHEKMTRYECSQCNFKTYDKPNLKVHLLRKHDNNDEGQWQECFECDFKTCAKACLEKHLLTRHGKGDERKWKKCPQCPYRSVNTNDFAKHIKVVHKKIQDYECTDCNFKTARKDLLLAHLCAKGGQIKYKECNLCSRKCRSDHFQTHLETVHKKFDCSVCNFKASRKDRLEMHLLVVHGKGDQTKWKACSQCTYKTTTPSNLTRHIRVVHEQIKD